MKERPFEYITEYFPQGEHGCLFPDVICIDPRSSSAERIIRCCYCDVRKPNGKCEDTGRYVNDWDHCSRGYVGEEVDEP